MCKEAHSTLIDRAIIPGTQGGPFMHTIAAKAVAFHEALQPEFVEYQQQVIKNAQAMATRFQELGYHIVANGTDTHLFVVDLQKSEMSGHEAQELLEKTGIIVSKSCVPFDPAKPWVTSGIRIGTAAITTQGADETKVRAIVDLIHATLHQARVHKQHQESVLI